MTTLTRIASIASLLLAVGCTTEPTPDGPLRPGSGGKGDDATASACGADEDLIAAARATLRLREAYYRDVEFHDALSTVDRTIGDLNGDGVDDVVVAPGLAYAGANSEWAVFLSAGGCPSVFAGSFGGDGVYAAEDGQVTNGVKDIIVGGHQHCDGNQTRHTWGGFGFVAGDTVVVDLCDEE